MQPAAPSAPFTITNRHGDVIRGDTHVPPVCDGAPVLVILHGFKGFKDWGSFPAIADHFARSGWITVRWNFSLNGIGEDMQSFTRLDDFRKNTYSRELDDVSDVLAAITERSILPSGADVSRIAVLGHSRGGGIAILAASADARVRAAVSWAAVASFDRWGTELKRQWRARGVLEVLNTRTRQKMPLGVELLEDCERNAASLDITAAAARLHAPLLIVHGEQDVSVPVEEARRIYAAAAPNVATLAVIPNADHTFGAVHPFEGITPALARALSVTTDWLAARLMP